MPSIQTEILTFATKNEIEIIRYNKYLISSILIINVSVFDRKRFDSNPIVSLSNGRTLQMIMFPPTNKVLI